jgi:hypothetical protein
MNTTSNKRKTQIVSENHAQNQSHPESINDGIVIDQQLF